jgi:hypothetical protein
MSDMLILALAVVVPFGLVILGAYKLITRKRRPKLTLVEQPFSEDEIKIAEESVKEVVAKAKKINKNKSRKGKRRAKKN